MLQESHPERADLREWLLMVLQSKFAMPKGTELKYDNMLEFYDHCMKRQTDGA